MARPAGVRNLTLTEQMLVKINRTLQENKQVTKEVAEATDKYGESIKEADAAVEGMAKRTQILTKTVNSLKEKGKKRMEFFGSLPEYQTAGGNILEYMAEFLTSAKEELTIFGVEAAQARKIMYGFLPPGMFRMMNKFSSVLRFVGGSLRKFKDGAQESNSILATLYKTMNFKLRTKKEKGMAKGFTSSEQMKEGEAAEKTYFKDAKKGTTKTNINNIKKELKVRLKAKKAIHKEMLAIKTKARKHAAKLLANGTIQNSKQYTEERRKFLKESKEYTNLESKIGKFGKEAGSSKTNKLEKNLKGELAYYDSYKKHRQFNTKLGKLQRKALKLVSGIWSMFKMVLRGAFFTFVYGTAALIALYIIFKKNGPAIMKAAKAAWTVIKIGIGIIQEAFGLIWEGAMDIWNGFFGDGDMASILVGLMKILGGVLWGLWGIVVVVLGGLFSFVGEFVLGIWTRLRDYFGNELISPVKKMGTIVAAIVASLVFIILLFSTAPLWIAAVVTGAVYLGIKWLMDKIPGFASGGVSKGGMTIVGERGPELVNLPRNSRVHSNRDSRKMMGNNQNTINITINARDTSDSELRRIAEKLGKMVNDKMNRTIGSRMFG